MAKQLESISIIVPNLQTNAAQYLTGYLAVHPLVQSSLQQIAEDKVKLTFRRATTSDIIKPFGALLIAISCGAFAMGIFVGKAKQGK